MKEHKFKTKEAQQKKRRRQILTEQRLNQQEKYNYASGAFD